MFAYVGSFTTERRQARGDGIHAYHVDAATGSWTHIQHIGGLTNPSYLALSPDQRFLYAVHGDEDYATAFALDGGTGSAKLLNRASTGGLNGVRQAIDQAGRFHGGCKLCQRHRGSAAHFLRRVAARSTSACGVARRARSPPRSADGCVAHDIVFDPSGRFVLVPDKGQDRVFAFHFDAGVGRLTPTAQGSVTTRPGAGPRHLAFHPRLPVVWVLNELDSTTTTYRWDADTGALDPVQVITTLPTDFTGYSTTAEIAITPDGRFVYCSNRGHDSVAIYDAHAASGLLAPVGWQATLGKRPRFIGLDPAARFLYAANEQGDVVVNLRVDPAFGTLAPTGQTTQVASPATIVFAGR